MTKHFSHHGAVLRFAAAAVVALAFVQAASAEIAVRVLRGESPANIPFQLVEKLKYTFNPDAAAQVGVVIPKELLSRGESVK